MKRKISELIGLFVIVFGAIFFVSFLSIIAINESRNTGGNSYHIDFEFIDIEGNLINSTNHTGKVIVLYFFTLSCPPCKISSPLLASIEDDYLSSQLLIITISMNVAD
jgi:thiol-disulfide isomerase/thioredoxin